MENNNKIICKADIKPKSLNKVLVIIGIISVIVFILSFIPITKFYMMDSDVLLGKRNIFGETVVDAIGWREEAYLCIFNEYASYAPISQKITLRMLIIFGGYSIMMFIAKATAKKCSLEMTDKGIYGNRKTLFSDKQLNLPIDKIDSIMMSNSIIDKLRGGKTVAVRSASGVVKFPWVQNADEFVNATLAKIDELKQQ